MSTRKINTDLRISDLLLELLKKARDSLDTWGRTTRQFRKIQSLNGALRGDGITSLNIAQSLLSTYSDYSHRWRGRLIRICGCCVSTIVTISSAFTFSP